MNAALGDTKRWLGGAFAALALAAWTAPATAETLAERANKGLVEVITGDVNDTTTVMAADLADVLDDGATRRVLPVLGKGSFQDLVDLKALRGIDLAIVQTDVLDEARARRLYPGLDTSLTYIAKLYNAEFHLLARRDIKDIGALAGKKVNLGPAGDGASLTGARVFEALKIKVETTAYGQRLALAKLRAGEIAAMAFVGGKPAPLFLSLPAAEGLHFLSVPLSPALASAYVPAQLTRDDYPGLVPPQGGVDTIAVGTVLIVANLTPGSERYRNVVNFVEAFFTQFPKLLEAPHHPKWSEVNLTAELPNWRRFPAAESWIKRNGATPVAYTEDQMRDIFAKFLDERGKVSGTTLTAAQKDQLFDQFKRWQDEHAR